ncbi:MAG: Rieske (2Fe-2S) iron-sulfur domain protein [Betaproteobacteria bacterium]|jgi:nitrite reductase (NADH) small subunit|nr:Rieske (2Fe-2S) iron-sulfur domain protein [Betaproteobacteria bacterium]MEA3155131.1 nitrite reductase small subunit [Betaproteobacteria bacterium]
MANVREKKEVSVGKAADFAVGQFKIVEIDGREIGITRLKSGELRAVRNHCPHKGAPVCKGIVGGTWLPCGPGEMVYGRDGEVLVCPWHGFEFDLLTGSELFQDKPLKLLMYAATERDGEVVVSV